MSPCKKVGAPNSARRSSSAKSAQYRWFVPRKKDHAEPAISPYFSARSSSESQALCSLTSVRTHSSRAESTTSDDAESAPGPQAHVTASNPRRPQHFMTPIKQDVCQGRTHTYSA